MIKFFLFFAILLVNWQDFSSIESSLPTINGRPISGLIRVDSMGDKSFQLPVRPALDKDYVIPPNDILADVAITDSDKDGVADAIDIHPNQAGALLNVIYNVPYNGKEYVFRLDVARDYADVYRSNMPHLINPDGSNVASFVIKDDPYINDLVDQAKSYAAKDKTIQTDQLLLALVKSLTYNQDAFTGRMEYPKYPIETLLDQSGDCEDLSILAVNLVGELKGYSEVTFISYPDHMAMGLKSSIKNIEALKTQGKPSKYVGNSEKAFLFQETTHITWSLGTIPVEFKNKEYKLYSVI